MLVLLLSESNWSNHQSSGWLFIQQSASVSMNGGLQQFTNLKLLTWKSDLTFKSEVRIQGGKKNISKVCGALESDLFGQVRADLYQHDGGEEPADGAHGSTSDEGGGIGGSDVNLSDCWWKRKRLLIDDVTVDGRRSILIWSELCSLLTLELPNWQDEPK